MYWYLINPYHNHPFSCTIFIQRNIQLVLLLSLSVQRCCPNFKVFTVYREETGLCTGNDRERPSGGVIELFCRLQRKSTNQ